MSRWPRVRWATVLIVSGFTVGSCSGTGDGSDEPTSASTADVPTSSADPAAPAAPRTDPGPSTTTPVPTTSATTVLATAVPATTTTTAAFPSAADELGLTPIEQLTPLDGSGEHPLLEWAAVEGAVRYLVVVLAPSGTVYWGWETTETSVPVGGRPQLRAGAPGPAVSDGMTWSVSAIDESGHVVGLSAHRPISP